MISTALRAFYLYPLTDWTKGQKTVGTSSTVVVTGGPYKRLYIQADPANTDNIWIAAPAPAAIGQGICLQPGERIELNGAVVFYAISGTASQSIGWMTAN